MPDRVPPPANVFAGSRLDRMATHRDDEELLGRHLASPHSRYLPLWRGRHLISEAGGTPRAAMPTLAELGPVDLDRHPWALLGVDGAGALFAVDLGALDDPAATLDGAPATWRFEELRPLAALLPREEAALLAQARGLLNWRAAHRYCGVCGAPNRPDQAGNRLVCANGHHNFPRTDPVVIMLVHHRDRALLARGTRFPPDSTVLSALAGFLEPGESAEEAVAREVFEEVGVRVRDVRYHSSQPWPFPGSLMLGYHAEAMDTALVLDPAEIVEARWLTREQMRQPDAHGFELPGPIAIARQLVEAWLAGD